MSKGSGKNKGKVPVDQDARDAIRNDLETTILVEAAAGTGKTTGMVGRMTALLAEGKCKVHELAAVTFTRKAAAELRDRFQAGLEEAVSDDDVPVAKRERLSAALVRVESCFVGTIHSFCARMLRERPVEARVNMDFTEIERDEDDLLRGRAWNDTVDTLIATGDPLPGELRKLGLEFGELETAFRAYVEFPDVDEWPAPDVPLPDPASAVKALGDYARHMEHLIPGFPDDTGNDKLMDRYRLVVRLYRQNDLEEPAELKEVFDAFTDIKPTLKFWPGGRKGGIAKAEGERWKAFRNDVAIPYVRGFESTRYACIMHLFRRARERYDVLRWRAGALNFQDLLMAAARLLRSGEHIRRYFRGRVTHLLVDEFQDTDPVQAEVMLLLTAADPAENDWKKCIPVPGSLFVVGDPKQSIYRFRRADIVTYNAVRDIVEASGGRILHLTTNFRTAGSIVQWVNDTFAKEFPERADDFSPAYVALEKWRPAWTAGPLGGVRVVEVPADHWRKVDAVAYEAGFIARTIRSLLGSGKVIPDDDGRERPIDPGDFLIVAFKTKHLAEYARALQDLDIPHQVTGGSALNDLEELRLLQVVLAAAVRPDDPVALVAVLRSELFGVSDRELFAYRDAGGEFRIDAADNSGFAQTDSKDIGNAISKLSKARDWLSLLPPAAAARRIARDLGLIARAGAGTGGDVLVGSLGKAFEILRTSQASAWSAVELVDNLRRITEQAPRYDGISARAHTVPVVRIMNLHKVKGLEAPIVFLADPAGKYEHPVECHVDRGGRKVRGYLVVRGPAYGERRQGRVLARPAGWDDFAKRENTFLKKEKTRLEYVAATRAGVQLSIVRKQKRNDYNPWQCFENYLTECPVLEDPGPQKAKAARRKTVSAADADKAEEGIDHRWKAAKEESYEVKLASEAGERDRTGTARTSKGKEDDDEGGAAWGRVIHQLLETALSEPGAKLESLAASLLNEEDLDTGRAAEALELVESVQQEDFWKRALDGDPCLAEVPVQVRMNDNGGDAEPEIVKGVIDLAFRGDGGWVIVDYKTDRGDTDRLVEKYRPQLDLYAAAWKRATGEEVSEKAIFFVHTKEYRQV